MSICVARQPVFTGSLKVHGYELFYRDPTDSIDDVSADTATSETIIKSFHDMGIDRVTNTRRAFVIFTEKLLLQEVATLLPHTLLVIKPDVDVPPSEEVVAACRLLYERGYRFAFDDYVLDPEYAPLLPFASYIRFDFSEKPADEIRRRLARMDTNKVDALARKLESSGTYELAKGMGFKLFQGRFFCKPLTVRADAKISPSKLSCLQLINLSLDPDANYDMMAEIIKRDVTLSYMLFRVVNSAYFGLLYTVTGIKHALTILGMAEIHKWITLISLARLCENKPNELISLSLIRARFMELIAPHAGVSGGTDEMFLIGLMSLMDVLLDMPLDQVFLKTGISENVSVPLLTGAGYGGRLLELLLRYEEGDWEKAGTVADEAGLSMDTVAACYKDAVKWSRRIT